MKLLFFNAAHEVRAGWKILGYFVMTICFAAGLIFIRRLFPHAVRVFVPEPLLAFFGAFLASWICLRLERMPIATLGFTVNWRFFRNVAVGLAGGATILLLVALVVWFLDGFHLVRNSEGVLPILLKSAWMLLAVALSEETVFRGYAFQRAIRGMGVIGAQLVFAIVFCLVHVSNPGMSASTMVFALLNIFLASLMLGYCYLRTGSLALPIGVHMGWDWAQSCLGFAGSGNESKGLWTPIYNGKPVWLTGGAFGLEASLVSIVILAVVVVALARWKGSRPIANLSLDTTTRLPLAGLLS